MKRINYLILISLLLSTTLFSQTQTKVIQLMAGDSPDDYKVFVSETGSDLNVRVSGVKVPSIELYIPSGKKNMPCVMICPGGGYRILSYLKEGQLLAEEFNKIGIAAAVLRYRLPAEKAEKKAPWMPLIDAQLGLQYLNTHAKELGLNKDKIGIMGFSAGGHLAASASTLFKQAQQADMVVDDIRPDFSILIYPVITMKEDFTHKGSKSNLLGGNPSPENIDLFSLEQQVTKRTPPTFLLHAVDDGGVPIENSRQYRDACVAAKVQVVLYELKAGGHGFGLGTSKSGEWFHFLSQWLDTTVSN